MAGALQDVPILVLAPHRGALLGSPGGFPFLSHPRRFAWGSFSFFLTSPPLVNIAYNSLSPFIDMDMLDRDLLLTSSSISFQSFHLRRERSQHLGCLVYVGLFSFNGLTGYHGSS